VGPVLHLAPRGPDDDPPCGGQALIAPAIDLESLARVVPFAAVGLDDDPLLAPDEVDAEWRPAVREHDELVGVGIGQAEGPRDRQQQLLVLVPGGCLTDVVGVEDAADCLGAAPGGVAGELVVDCLQVQGLEDFGLVEGALELALGEDVAEVEEGAGDGRDGDAVDDGDVGFGEGRGAMNGYT
jgi:hypothetical protein